MNEITTFTDDNGRVTHITTGEGINYRALYPYRANMIRNGFGGWKQDGWNNVSGCYKPAYLARLEHEGMIIWR